MEGIMEKSLALAVMISFLVVPALATTTPTPGIQVVECGEDPPGSGTWWYLFFACVGDFQANDLHIALTPAEIAEGTVVVGCSVPVLPGFSCASAPGSVDYYFPLVGPWACVPGISGQYFDVWLNTPDGSTIVIETWTLDGDPIASFTTLIACPPTGTEASTWGQVKTLFR
jgi:hypothetical protein